MTSPIGSIPDLCALAGSWTLDPARTSITFHAKALWLLTVTGTFGSVEGAGTVADDGSVAGTLVVDAASVNTNNRQRDKHLRSADFFDVGAHPAITFTVTQARPGDGGQVDVIGDLTVRGHTRPLTVAASVSAGDDAATVTAEVRVDRSNWGLRYTKKGSRLATHLLIEASFVRS